MRILLIDHGCCDHPHTRVHRLREGLEAAGVTVAVCGPSRLHGLDANRRFLAAVQDGGPEAFLMAVADVPSRLLGLARETARQMIAEAADALYPDAIFVLHAGILTDLAVETGAPVVVHVATADLEAAAGRPSLKRLVRSVLGSCDGIVAADAAVAESLLRDWLGGDAEQCLRCETWPIDGADAAARVVGACAAALARRRGE